MANKIYKDILLKDIENRGAFNGDAPSVSGESLLEHRMIKRMSAALHSLTHRPNYGAGLIQRLGEVGNAANLMAAQRQTRLAALDEEDVVEAQTRAYDTSDGPVVELSVVRRGETQPQTIVFRREE